MMQTHDRLSPNESMRHRIHPLVQWTTCIPLGLTAAALPLWLLSDLMHVGDMATMHVALRLGLLTTTVLLAQRLITQASGVPSKQWLWLFLPAGLWAAAWPILDFETSYTTSELVGARSLPWWDTSITKWGGLTALQLLGWALARRVAIAPGRAKRGAPRQNTNSGDPGTCGADS